MYERSMYIICIGYVVSRKILITMIICHDFIPSSRRGGLVESDCERKFNNIYQLGTCVLIVSSCAFFSLP